MQDIFPDYRPRRWEFEAEGRGKSQNLQAQFIDGEIDVYQELGIITETETD
jgi:hypothetical protein